MLTNKNILNEGLTSCHLSFKLAKHNGLFFFSLTKIIRSINPIMPGMTAI